MEVKKASDGISPSSIGLFISKNEENNSAEIDFPKGSGYIASLSDIQLVHPGIPRYLCITTRNSRVEVFGCRMFSIFSATNKVLIYVVFG